MTTPFWNEDQEVLDDDLPPLTDTVLAGFERRTGLRLPAELAALLLQRNGGSLHQAEFRVGKSEVISLDDLMGVADKPAWNAISTLAAFLHARGEEVEAWRGVVADPQRVLLLSGDGHWFYALDYGVAGTTKPPTVVHIELECGPARRQIATSFAAFLAMAYAGDPEPSIDWASAPGELLAEDRVCAVSRHDRNLNWNSHCRCFRRGKTLVVRCERDMWGGGRELTEGLITGGKIEVDGFSGMIGQNADPPFAVLNISRTSGMVRVTTCRYSQGRWKNQTDDLAYVMYDCADQERADAVAALIGAAPPSSEDLAQRALAQRAMEAMGDPAKLVALQQEMMAQVMGDLERNLSDLESELAKPPAKARKSKKRSP